MRFTEVTKPMNDRVRFTRSVRNLLVALLLLAVCGPTAARGQLAPSSDSLTIQPSPSYPVLSRKREIALSGVGAGLLVTGLLIAPDQPAVPVQGFDVGEITWSLDRDIVGNRSRAANAAGDWTRDAALVFPLALSLGMGQGSERWHGFSRSSLVYAETILLSQGLTLLGKSIVGRARPFAYLPVGERPGSVHYDVSADRTFKSMPSGHSSSAWAGATLGMTMHLLQRPQASWVERVGVGFLGGAFAGATSALRVEAGQHFPSDVLVGAGIGLATGLTVPLLHRGEQSIPTNAVLEMIGGGLAGTFVGVLIARGY